MKAWLFVLVVAVAFSASAQTPVLESQKEAVRQYPALADPQSKLNKKFVELVNATKISDPSFLQRDDWPMLLAKRAAEMTGKGAADAAPAAMLLDRPGQATTLDRTPPGVNPLAVTAGRIILTGTVKQRTADGLLIQTRASGETKGDSGQVWLSGYDAKQGTRISIPAVRSGTYDYTTVAGAQRLIDAYTPAR